MQRNFSILIMILAISLVIQTASATNYYNTEFFLQDTATPYYIEGYSFYYDGSCTSTVESHATLTGSNYDFSSIYYSPDNIQIGTASRYGIPSAITCYTLGAFSSSTSLNDYYEGKFTGSTTGSGQMTLTNSYSCSMSGDWIEIIYRRNDGDSYSNNPYIYWGNDCSALPTLGTSDLAESENNYCEANPTFSPHSNATYSYSCNNDDHRMIMAFPVNGSGGILNYHFDFTSDYAINCHQFDSNGAVLYLKLMKYSTGAITTLNTSSVTCTWGSPQSLYTNITGTTPVDEDEMYMLILEWFHDDGGKISYDNFRLPTFANISIYTYHADWNCTEWSDCINGSQYRQCYDLNDKSLPKTEYQSCFEFAEEQVFLGFSEYENVDVWYCSESSLLQGCGMTSEIRERKYPSGWFVTSNLTTDSPTGRTAYLGDYIDMSTTNYYEEDEGTIETSLKIWYIPRKSWLPRYNESGLNEVLCNETTQGQIPQVYRDDINESFWIANNITVLSPYMYFSFRVMKCQDPVLQTTGGFGCFGLGLTKGCNDTGIDYYTWDGCHESPYSSVGVALVEYDNGTYGDYLVFEGINVDANNFEDGYYEYFINDLNISSSYVLAFSEPTPQGIEEPDSYCVYIDDVNVNFRNEPVICESRCEDDYDGDGINDYTYIRATPIGEDSCKISVIKAHPDCVPSDVRDEAEDYEDFCVGTKLYTYNNETFEYDIIEDADYCIEQYQQEQQLEESTSPIQLFEDYGITDYMTESGFGFAIIFITPIFWTFIIALLIGAVVTYYSESFELGLAGFMGILILASMPQFGIFPFWFIIVFIVIGGISFARFVTKAFSRDK